MKPLNIQRQCAIYCVDMPPNPKNTSMSFKEYQELSKDLGSSEISLYLCLREMMHENVGEYAFTNEGLAERLDIKIANLSRLKGLLTSKNYLRFIKHTHSIVPYTVVLGRMSCLFYDLGIPSTVHVQSKLLRAVVTLLNDNKVVCKNLTEAQKQSITEFINNGYLPEGGTLELKEVLNYSKPQERQQLFSPMLFPGSEG